MKTELDDRQTIVLTARETHTAPGVRVSSTMGELGLLELCDLFRAFAIALTYDPEQVREYIAGTD